MTKDKIANDSYRKLTYFFEKGIKIHFKDFDDIFYNGNIIELDYGRLTMILDEDVKGTMVILLECVNPDSIRKFEEVRE